MNNEIAKKAGFHVELNGQVFSTAPNCIKCSSKTMIPNSDPITEAGWKQPKQSRCQECTFNNEGKMRVPNSAGDACELAPTCSTNKFFDLVESECRQCSAGFTSPAGTIGKQGCTCAPGHFLPAPPNEPSCTLCPIGWRRGEGWSNYQCIQCFSPTIYSNAERTGCSSSNSEGTSSSVNCAPGQKKMISNTDIPDYCMVCGAGYYQNEMVTSDVLCKKCPVGTFNSDESNLITNHDGENDCQECARGFYSGAQAAKSCDGCTEGQYNNQIKQTSCKTCRVGMYSDQKKQLGCKSCPAGTYLERETPAFNDAESDCKDCVIGRFSHAEAATCQTCSRGKFNDQTKQALCKDCPVGKKLTKGQGVIANHDQASDCDDCPGGKYNDNVGWYEECPLCTNGDQTQKARTSCDGVNEDGSVTCSSGKFKQSGQCVDCSVGKYNDVQDGACKDCELGLYNDEKRQTEW